MALELSTALLEEDYKKTGFTAPTAPPEAFEEDENNPRFEHIIKPEFDEDIKQRGILQPLIVRINEHTGKFIIRFGSRRFRAAKRLGLKEIPYVITEDPRQFDDYAQISENEQREPLTPLELAKFIQRKIDGGDKKKLIAEKLHINAGEIAQYQALINAPPFIMELYESKKCRSVRYLYELRNLYNQYGDKLVQLCYEVNNFTRSKIDEINIKLSIEKTANNRMKIAFNEPIKPPEVKQEEQIAKDVPKSENSEILCITKKSNQEPQESVVFETKSRTDFAAVPQKEPELPSKQQPGPVENVQQRPLEVLALLYQSLERRNDASLKYELGLINLLIKHLSNEQEAI